jgi:glycosyltransferase involved in cell wall biosynthesis
LLTGLARHYRVHLCVLPVADGTRDIPDQVAALAARVMVVALHRAIDTHARLITRVLDPAEKAAHIAAYPRPWSARFCTPEAAAEIKAWWGDAAPNGVAVMRLYLAPLGLAVAGEATRLLLLDLDDDEATAHQRQAAIWAERGEALAAQQSQRQAEMFAQLANDTLRRFDAVAVCSNADAQRLAAQHADARFVVLPNVYSPIADPPPRRRADGVLRLLLVGNMGYLPNADAAQTLSRTILPALRQYGREVHLDIVGAGDPGALPDDPGVQYHGAMEHLAPFYAQADIAVVPLRAAGGTRIKILEAMAYRVPVVASAIAAEGLGLIPETHFLCADDPDSFARACLRLYDEQGLATRLTEAAALMSAHFTPECLHAQLAAVLADIQPSACPHP